jgi:hypothetical protein
MVTLAFIFDESSQQSIQFKQYTVHKNTNKSHISLVILSLTLIKTFYLLRSKMSISSDFPRSKSNF